MCDSFAELCLSIYEKHAQGFRSSLIWAVFVKNQMAALALAVCARIRKRGFVHAVCHVV